MDEAPRYVCPCCHYRTLLNADDYDICPVCRWEDDPDSRRHGPDAHSGPNHMSLNEARATYARLGVVKADQRPYAREPRPEESTS
ncbi:MAG: hypothetical protein AVDCRST_MAG53-988 [uncultured Solirubrobacteraceae bacterium]|uniref:Cysteine-rich CPCC domain-containing protein n=1 Tax=uncultured Solirubrobacteraceae bacterium TaxID=1162706 RepID=A0A6J4RZG1_9ACTN|nr:MAG: hypothetical protein AVDCRST_MAG53-988 [uncultured Solirubrobacteraceae bacterium]